MTLEFELDKMGYDLQFQLGQIDSPQFVLNEICDFMTKE